MSAGTVGYQPLRHQLAVQRGVLVLLRERVEVAVQDLVPPTHHVVRDGRVEGGLDKESVEVPQLDLETRVFDHVLDDAAILVRLDGEALLDAVGEDDEAPQGVRFRLHSREHRRSGRLKSSPAFRELLELEGGDLLERLGEDAAEGIHGGSRVQVACLEIELALVIGGWQWWFLTGGSEKGE